MAAIAGMSISKLQPPPFKQGFYFLLLRLRKRPFESRGGRAHLTRERRFFVFFLAKKKTPLVFHHVKDQ